MQKVIERMLPCKLTHLEIHEKIKKLRVKMDELREINTREKGYKEEIKEAKKEVEPDINILTKEISEEQELRTVKCAVMYDSVNLDCYTVRLDTHEQVGKPRRMTQEEIETQVNIDLVKEAEKGPAGEAETSADGAEPANLEPAEASQEDQEGQPGATDPDGWLADGDAALKAAGAAQEGNPTPAAEGVATAPQEGQETPATDPVDDWENIEFPAGQDAQEASETKDQA